MQRVSKTSAQMAAACSALLFLSACSGATGASEGEQIDQDMTDEVIEINYGSWVTGAPPVSNMWVTFLEDDEEIQEKYGITFTNEPYSNLQALYTDLSQGRIDGVSAGPSSMAANAAQGAPIRLAGSVARSTAGILSTDKGWTVEELEGSRLVAPTGTATWDEVELQIEDFLGLVAGEDYELVSSDNIGGAVTQLAAGTADYAMAWGEYIPNALAEFENVTLAATPEELAGDDEPFWQFSVTVHESVPVEGSDRLLLAAEEIVDWMQANPEEVEAKAVEGGQNEGIGRAMIEEFQNFEVAPMNESYREDLEKSFEALIESGSIAEMPPQEFWGE